MYCGFSHCLVSACVDAALQGIARRLVKLAMLRAGRKRTFSFADLKALGPSRRRQVHDDITVIVLFFDAIPGKVEEGAGKMRELSVRSMQPLAKPGQGGEDGKVVVEEEDVADDFEVAEKKASMSKSRSMSTLTAL